MIISGKQVPGVLKTYAEQTKMVKNITAAAKSSQQQDEVILSTSVQEFGQILQQLKDAPDVREDKVKDISARMENGTYRVEAKDIAEKMLNGMLFDSLT